MPSEYNIGAASSGNLNNTLKDFEISARQTDAAQNQDETSWINQKWSTWLGYYKEIPEFKRSIDILAKWTLGKGYRAGRTINGVFVADAEVQSILDNIKGGPGKENFNLILKNMIVTRQISGDAFAEIIFNKDSGQIINLKTLDPGSMKIIVNRTGKIIRYEQINKISKEKEVLHKFKPEEILHLSRDRVADEMHGVSVTESVEWIITARKEAMTDMKKFMHRFVKPMMKFILNTDNETEIEKFITKYDRTVELGDNLYVPRDTVQHELISVPTNATLNPLPWIDYLNNAFYQAVGIPQIIIGGSPHLTESSSKITYLSFQQTIEDEQLDIETQIWQQLALRIELDFPASLQNELLSDENKDGPQGQMNIQPSEMTAGVGE